jgi:DNA-binding SARP family transcriptional activator
MIVKVLSVGATTYTRPQEPSLVMITLMGAFTLTINGTAVTQKIWSRNDSLFLFKLLLLRRGDSLTRKNIIDSLWPDCAIDTGRHRLSNALSALRKDLDAIAGENFSISFLFATNDTLTCAPARELITDVDLFEADLDFASTSTDPTERRALLDRAIAFYRGDLLSDCPMADWFSSERQLLRHRYIEALRSADALAQEAGDVDSRFAYLEKLSRDIPDDEAVALEQMILHARFNRTREVEVVFKQLRREMASRSGQRPSDEAFALFNRLTNEQLPKQSLMQLPRPVSPILARPTDSLVGVDHIVQQIVDTVVSKAHSTVVIAGPDGVGKTSLLRHALWRLSLQHGINATVSETADQPSIATSNGGRHVYLYLDIDRGDDVYALITRIHPSNSENVAIITTNAAHILPQDISGVTVFHIEELSQLDSENLFSQRTLGLARTDTKILATSADQLEPKLSRCLKKLGGFPRTICLLSEQYLEHGSKYIDELAALLEGASLVSPRLAQQIQREKRVGYTQLDNSVRCVVELLCTTQLRLTADIVAESLNLSSKAAAAALEQGWSCGLLRTVSSLTTDYIYAATFEGHCVSLLNRIERGLTDGATAAEMVGIQNAMEKSWSIGCAETRWTIVNLLHLNSTLLIHRVKESAMSTAPATDIRWIRQLHLWLDTFDKEQLSAVGRLNAAIEAVLALVSLADEPPAAVSITRPNSLGIIHLKRAKKRADTKQLSHHQHSGLAL